MKTTPTVWLLEKGAYYNDRGMVVVAAKTKAAMLRWIKANYPQHKRNRQYSADSAELFFENDDQRTWLRCERNDHCPLLG